MAEEQGANLHQIQAEVTAAHTRLDAQGRELGDIKTSQRAMDAKLDQLLQREPSKMPIFALGGILAVLLTVLTLVITPTVWLVRANTADDKLDRRAFHAHTADGHPQAVLDKLRVIDETHSDEHLEQEEDIAELRAKDQRFEERVDAISETIVRLDTIAMERTARFKSRLDMVEKTISDKAGDRWTGSQQGVYQHQHEREHDLHDATIRSQLNYLRQEQEQSEALQHQLRGPGRELGRLYKEQAR